MNKQEFDKQLGEGLKKNILKKYKSQKEFAKIFNESDSTVSIWLKGGAFPSIFKLYEICKAMGITIDSLVESTQSEGYIDDDLFNEVFELAYDLATSKNLAVNGYYFLGCYSLIKNYIKEHNNISVQEAFNNSIPTILNLIKTLKK